MAAAPLELTTTSVVEKFALVHDLLSTIGTDDYARLSPATNVPPPGRWPA